MAPFHEKTTAKPEDGDLNWDAMLATGMLQLASERPLEDTMSTALSQREDATMRLEAYAALSDLAHDHMITLVADGSKARAGVVTSLVAEAHVVVATMGDYCKYRAGSLHGVARGVLDQLQTTVALLDESEAYHIDQAVAALGGVGAFDTVV